MLFDTYVITSKPRKFKRQLRGLRETGSWAAVIKLFEAENEVKCKNHLRDFIELLYDVSIFKHFRKFSKTLYHK